MASQKNVFEVQIAGMSFKLKTLHDEKAVAELVSCANKKIEECMPLARNGSIQTAAILAVLNLVEELFMLKSQALGELELIEQKAQKISSNLDAFHGSR